jgi:hypothetical protein
MAETAPADPGQAHDHWQRKGKYMPTLEWLGKDKVGQAPS